MIAGFIGKDIENYGLLSISDKGKAYLEHPTPFRISRDCEYEETGDDETIVSSPPRGGGGAADEELFGMLKDLRKKVSKSSVCLLSSYFQDPSLEDMAAQYPVTIEEMTGA